MLDCMSQVCRNTRFTNDFGLSNIDGRFPAMVHVFMHRPSRSCATCWRSARTRPNRGCPAQPPCGPIMLDVCGPSYVTARAISKRRPGHRPHQSSTKTLQRSDDTRPAIHMQLQFPNTDVVSIPARPTSTTSHRTTAGLTDRHRLHIARRCQTSLVGAPCPPGRNVLRAIAASLSARPP